MTFGEKLRNARKESGLSQEQFAEKMNVSRSAVAKWETDKGMPDITNLMAMSQLLNVSVDYLISDEDEISFNAPLGQGFKFNDKNSIGHFCLILFEYALVDFASISSISSSLS